ncbi:MAG: SDR family oxidoreductase [Actinomycetota bacterium]
MTDTVLGTGATGFIAQHCILQLLDQGYRVRGTARGEGRTEEVATVLRPHLGPVGRERLADGFEVANADLTVDAGWADAVAGCRFVLHVASPLPRTPPRHENDVIVPARDGVLRVLRAAEQSGVERVVLTSSVAAVMYGRDRDHTFTEDDWSDLDDRRIGAYEKSKTLAERAAWDFMAGLGDDAPMSLAVINPGLVLGPLLSEDWGTSGEAVKKLIDRDFPAIPNINFACVDVRDVATAHLAAMVTPEAGGERFLCGIENPSLREVAAILDEHLRPRGFKVPTGNLPDFMIRIVSIWDKTARLALNDLAVHQDLDNSKIRRVLGWEPRGLREMVTSMADSMIEYGVVRSPKP